MTRTEERHRTTGRWTLARVITATIVAVVALVSVSILAIAERNATSQRSATAEQVVDETVDLIADELGRGVRSVRLLESALSPDRWQDAALVESFLVSVVDLDGGIDTAYIGYSDGSFRGVFRSDDQTNIVRVDADSGRGVEMASVALGEEPDFEAAGEIFDPRTRPWFTQAVDDDRVSWTTSYDFFGGDERGVSGVRSLSASGDTVAVIGFDVRFARVESMIASVEARDGVEIVVEEDSEIVASTADSRALMENSRSSSNQRLTRSNAELPDWTVRTMVAEVGVRDVLTPRTITALILVLLVAACCQIVASRVRRRVQRRLETLGTEARRDHLTGLSNRRAVEEGGQLLIDEHRRKDLEVCVAILDLDDFKSINDDHGHAAGDQTIQRAATALASVARHGDVVGRLGGDEFVWIFAAPTHEVGMVVRRMHTEITRSLGDGERSWDTSVTLGATERRGRDVSLAEMLIEADECLIALKRTSKGDWSIAAPLGGEPQPASIFERDQTASRSRAPVSLDG